MLRHQESPSDCTPDLSAYIHALYAKIPQAIILSTVRPFMYLAGVKVGLGGQRTHHEFAIAADTIGHAEALRSRTCSGNCVKISARECCGGTRFISAIGGLPTFHFCCNGGLTTPICRSPFSERLFSPTYQSHKTPFCET